jgi:acetyltransferase-like isoleucine patch superfamily enzyme
MNLAKNATMVGKWPETVGLPWSHFEIRGCFLDCHGPLVIDAGSFWGFGVTCLTRSHDIASGPGGIGPVVPYGVQVEKDAWIGSYSVLAGCHVGQGAIVAAGTVVRGQTVAPGVMVAGNPARVIARWNGKEWEYLPPGKSGYTRNLA